MSGTEYSTSNELRSQWANPTDVLSLLLLIGGDTVQKAIAQLVGYTIRPFGTNRCSIGITPVALSFGWVAYGFSNLLSAMGDKRLMPNAESPSIVVNCSNAFRRQNQSWVLGRILRDYEASREVDSSDPADGQIPSTQEKGRAESIRIDIFELEIPTGPRLDLAWWLGWLTMAVQVGFALLPLVQAGDWGVMPVVLCGNLLALFTCALPQWRQEKWAGRKLTSENVFCLTRGNGSLNLLVFICPTGTWNLETLATASSIPRPETPALSLILTILWICLLISVAGLREHAWYLVAIGGVGMLQNVYAAGKVRSPKTADFHWTKFSRKETIIGKRQKVKDDMDSTICLDEALNDVAELSRWQQASTGSDIQRLEKMPKWLHSMNSEDGTPAWLQPSKVDHEIANIHGALMELEKWVPTAGLAMLQVYFPTALQYEDKSIRDNIHKKFWRRAYHTNGVRRRAEQARKEMERNLEGKNRQSQRVYSPEGQV